MNAPDLVTFPVMRGPSSVLSVYEHGQHVPFDITRVFTVTANAGEVRGEHAHKRCTQLMVCLTGSIKVSIDTGTGQNEYVLEDSSAGLLVPVGNWVKLEYMSERATLMVLCDRVYEADDYLHTHEDFMEFIGKKDP